MLFSRGGVFRPPPPPPHWLRVCFFSFYNCSSRINRVINYLFCPKILKFRMNTILAFVFRRFDLSQERRFRSMILFTDEQRQYCKSFPRTAKEAKTAPHRRFLYPVFLLKVSELLNRQFGILAP